MTTKCSSCGKQLQESSTSAYQLCKKCNRFVATGAGQKKPTIKNIQLNSKEEKVMVVKEKKFTDALKAEVISLAASGMSNTDISKKYNGSPNPSAIKRWIEKSKVN